VITVAQHALRKVKHVLALADSASLSFPFVCPLSLPNLAKWLQSSCMFALVSKLDFLFTG